MTCAMGPWLKSTNSSTPALIVRVVSGKASGIKMVTNHFVDYCCEDTLVKGKSLQCCYILRMKVVLRPGFLRRLEYFNIHKKLKCVSLGQM